MNLGDTLTVANRLLTGDRNAAYGNPAETYERAAQIASGILGVPVHAEDVLWVMVAVKLAREVRGHKPDNLVDLAAYCDIMNCHFENHAATNG